MEKLTSSDFVKKNDCGRNKMRKKQFGILPLCFTSYLATHAMTAFLYTSSSQRQRRVQINESPGSISSQEIPEAAREQSYHSTQLTSHSEWSHRKAGPEPHIENALCNVTSLPPAKTTVPVLTAAAWSMQQPSSPQHSRKKCTWKFADLSKP